MSADVEIRLAPREGTPEVLSHPKDIRAAAKRLADGTGWLAVDTERASAYRYDDRAFLLQFRRRGAGTILIDPEFGRAAMTELGACINELTWVIHAAPSDLPCLAALGLYPRKVIDTELAARMLGLERVNLAALSQNLLGVGLAKGHGKEDWSTRPLPSDWLDYAALDVELLIQLAEFLTQALGELNRLEWFEEECAHELEINRKYAAGLHVGRSWRALKGVGKLRDPEQLNVARVLWTARDHLACDRDVSPTHLLAHRVICDIAERLPNSTAEIARIKGFPRRRRGAADFWFTKVTEARKAPESSWPAPEPRPRSHIPNFRNWEQCAPKAAELYTATRSAISTVCAELSLRTDTLITVSQTRDLVWWMHTLATDSAQYTRRGDYPAALPTVSTIASHLNARGFRRWQAHLLADVIGARILAPMRYPL